MSCDARPAVVDRGARLAYVPAFPSHRLRFFMFTFLLVLQAVIAFSLVATILVQKSEGGGLGMGGGSPSGLMSARGAADFLTRLTTILATLFVGLSIGLAVIAAAGHTSKIDSSLATKAPQGGAIPAGQIPTTQTAPQNPAAPASAPASNGAVPLQQ